MIIAHHSAHEWAEISVPDEAAAWAWLEAQVGKPYDLSALLMFVNPWRDWREDDAWFCSELIAGALRMFRNAARVSPEMLYAVSRFVENGYPDGRKGANGIAKGQVNER